MDKSISRVRMADKSIDSIYSENDLTWIVFHFFLLSIEN